MADTFRQLEMLEAMSFVYSRLEKHGLKMQTMVTNSRRTRYMIVSIEHNFVVKQDLTFSQVAAYAAAIDAENPQN